jgi:DNA-binding CsgD family transcriptional regulator
MISLFLFLSFSSVWIVQRRFKGGGIMNKQDVTKDFIMNCMEVYKLSPREMEVMYYWFYDYNVGSIAKCLEISNETVRTLIKRSYRKMNVDSKSMVVFTVLNYYFDHV